MKKLKKCFFPRREEKRREKREREERERESGHCIGARAEEEETYFAKGVEAFSLFSSSTSSSSLLFSSFGSNSSLSLSLKEFPSLLWKGILKGKLGDMQRFQSSLISGVDVARRYEVASALEKAVSCVPLDELMLKTDERIAKSLGALNSETDFADLLVQELLKWFKKVFERKKPKQQQQLRLCWRPIAHRWSCWSPKCSLCHKHNQSHPSYMILQGSLVFC